MLPEIAVLSGDTVRRDEDGFLYFIGRRDEMIKTSGYRVSPTEVEEVLYATGLVGDAGPSASPHPTLGQAIVVVAAPPDGGTLDGEALLDAVPRSGCRPTWCRRTSSGARTAAAQPERQDRPADARGRARTAVRRGIMTQP